jgi:hypothetical protein
METKEIAHQSSAMYNSSQRHTFNSLRLQLTAKKWTCTRSRLGTLPNAGQLGATRTWTSTVHQTNDTAQENTCTDSFYFHNDQGQRNRRKSGETTTTTASTTSSTSIIGTTNTNQNGQCLPTVTVSTFRDAVTKHQDELQKLESQQPRPLEKGQGIITDSIAILNRKTLWYEFFPDNHSTERFQASKLLSCS